MGEKFVHRFLFPDLEGIARSTIVRTLHDASMRDAKEIGSRESKQQNPKAENGDAKVQQLATAVQVLLYELQSQHVDMYMEMEGLRASLTAGNAVPPQAKSDAIELAEVRAAIAVVVEQVKLAEETSAKVQRAIVMQQLKDCVQEIRRLQRELKEKFTFLDNLAAQNSRARATIMSSKDELNVLVVDRVLSLEDAFVPFSKQLLDMCSRQIAHLESVQLLRLSEKALHTTRIHCRVDAEPLAQIVQVLNCGGDDLFRTIFDAARHLWLFEISKYGAGARSLKSSGAAGEAATEMSALVARATASEKTNADGSKKVRDLAVRADNDARSVLALRAALQTAFQEWSTMPAQFCIPNTQFRERYQRRYEHVKVLANNYFAKTTKKK